MTQMHKSYSQNTHELSYADELIMYDAILHHCITTFFPGATPYEDLSMATLLAQIISGYRLPMPELASDKM